MSVHSSILKQDRIRFLDIPQHKEINVRMMMFLDKLKYFILVKLPWHKVIRTILKNGFEVLTLLHLYYALRHVTSRACIITLFLTMFKRGCKLFREFLSVFWKWVMWQKGKPGFIPIQRHLPSFIVNHWTSCTETSVFSSIQHSHIDFGRNRSPVPCGDDLSAALAFPVSHFKWYCSAWRKLQREMVQQNARCLCCCLVTSVSPHLQYTCGALNLQISLFFSNAGHVEPKPKCLDQSPTMWNKTLCLVAWYISF